MESQTRASNTQHLLFQGFAESCTECTRDELWTSSREREVLCEKLRLA